MEAASKIYEVFASDYILQLKFNVRCRHLIPVNVCELKLTQSTDKRNDKVILLNKSLNMHFRKKNSRVTFPLYMDAFFFFLI